MNKKILNNKGFAITTILFGMLVLFLLLLVSLLSILSLYRGNLEKLIDANNGARTIATMEAVTYASFDELKTSGNTKGGLYCFSATNSCRYVSTKELTGETDEVLGLDAEYAPGDYYKETYIDKSGYYYIEAIGAAGGNASYNGKEIKGGAGAKTSGYIYLDAGQTLYAFVGGAGRSSAYGSTDPVAGGYNGGGSARGKKEQVVASGGGSSDIRIGDNFGDINLRKDNIIDTLNSKKVKTGETADLVNKINNKVGTYTVTGLNGKATADSTIVYNIPIEDKALGTYRLEIFGNLSTSCTYAYTNASQLKIFDTNDHKSVYIKTSKVNFNIKVTCKVKVASYNSYDEYINRLIYSRLEDRIMVAAGGGGAVYHKSNEYGVGGNGGALLGLKGQLYKSDVFNAYAGGGALQTTAGANKNGTAGSFGYAGFVASNGTVGTAGGGGGYYGGGASVNGGGGGSSYVSGYAGVDSVDASKVATHTKALVHYSGKYFIDAVITPGVNAITNDNSGDGKISIRYVGNELPKRENTYLSNVRYVKDCINGNSKNDSNHWVEIQVIKNGVNIAAAKSITGSSNISSADRIVNGVINNNNGSVSSGQYASSNEKGLQCVIVDLGTKESIDEITVWHYYQDDRNYYNKVTYVSSDGKIWIPVIDVDDSVTDSYDGFRVNAWNFPFNYSVKYTGKFSNNASGSTKIYEKSYARFVTDDWQNKFLSSGTLNVLDKNITTDVFLVGGGGGGSNAGTGSGGGGGYVKTVNELELSLGTNYQITIGNGGAKNTAGGATSLVYGAETIKVSGGDAGTASNGGNGGSGGGGAGDKRVNSGAGGSNGSDGTSGNKGTAGIGCLEINDDISTSKWNCKNGGTHAFGEENGELYASGGSGRYNETLAPGGGGNGGSYSKIKYLPNATLNTGGGGGYNGTGANGVVIIRNSFIHTETTIDNKIKVSIGQLLNPIKRYCINNSPTDYSTCVSSGLNPKSSFTAYRWSQSGEEIGFEPGNYYIHIIDDVENVFTSSVVRITPPFSTATFDFDGMSSTGRDRGKFYVMLKESGELVIKEDTKVEIFMVSAGADSSVTNRIKINNANLYYNEFMINNKKLCEILTVHAIDNKYYKPEVCHGIPGGSGGKSDYFTTTLTEGTYQIKIGTSDNQETNIYKDNQLIGTISGYNNNGGTFGMAFTKTLSCNCPSGYKQNNKPIKYATHYCYYCPSGFNFDGKTCSRFNSSSHNFVYSSPVTTAIGCSLNNYISVYANATSGGDGVLAFGGNTDIATMFGAGGAGSMSSANNSIEDSIPGGKTTGGGSGTPSSPNGQDAAENSGSGGGAKFAIDAVDGKGGSGVIIIRAYNQG